MSKTLITLMMIATIAISLLGTLIWLVMTVASMPNSKPEDAAFYRNVMIGTGVGGLVCTVAGAWLVYLRHPWWGSGIGCLPIVSFVVFVIYVSVK